MKKRLITLWILTLLIVSFTTGCVREEHRKTSSAPSASAQESSCSHVIWSEYNEVAHQCNACGVKEPHIITASSDGKSYCTVCYYIVPSETEESSAAQTAAQETSKEESSSESSAPQESSQPAPTPQHTAISSLAFANVGDYVSLGQYDQGYSSGKDPITWLVLEKRNGMVLLISAAGIDRQVYHDTDVYVTWENSWLRSWLNSTFYTSAFSSVEQSAIALTHLSNPDNTAYSVDGGNDTDDRIFLLSVDEANAYFASDLDRMTYPTPHAIDRGCYVDEDSFSCWWWLRTPGKQTETPHQTFVTWEGTVHTGGYVVNHSYGCVRPAMWVYYQ